MRLLIDSHALIWYVDQHQQLSSASHGAMSDPANDLLLSAASIWEIAIKISLGKLVLTQLYLTWMSQALSDLRITVLPITVEYADTQASLPKHHTQKESSLKRWALKTIIFLSPPNEPCRRRKWPDSNSVFARPVARRISKKFGEL